LNYERLGKELDKLIETSSIAEPEYCGVDSKGQSHGSDEFCPNAEWDELGYSTYCSAQYRRNLLIKRDNYQFVSSMLEYYWQKGIKKSELKFLEINGFITSYEYCV
jgi:hypothetical protein